MTSSLLEYNLLSQFHYINPLSTEFQYIPSGLYHFYYYPWHAWGFVFFHLFQCWGNFIHPDTICWSFFICGRYSMIPFIFFIHQLFHVLLTWTFNPFLVYYHFTWYTFQTVWPHYTMPFFYHLLCYSKNFIFCWSGSFKSLAHSFCFFLFAKEITFFCVLFPLLVLLPCLCRFFFFFNLHTFSSFPLLLQQLPHSTTMFPMPAWTF